MEKVDKPWGSYQVLYETDYCKVKILTVNPQSKLSYQSHKHRDEEWTVLKGNGRINLNGYDVPLSSSKIIIQRGDKHRLINDTDEELVVLEIQTGDYFGEDDIIRFNDDYGRD